MRMLSVNGAAPINSLFSVKHFSAKNPLTEKNASNNLRLYASLLHLFSLLTIAVPLLTDCFSEAWLRQNDTQGPIILLAVTYAYLRDISVLQKQVRVSVTLAGFFIAVLGMALFSAGRTVDFLQIETSGFILVIFGLTLLSGGYYAVWFFRHLEIATLLVMPLPQAMADSLLLSLKLLIASGVVELLHSVGLPIAKGGAVIVVGFDQIGLADACAGLTSLLSLSALSFIVIHFARMRGKAALLLIIATPIIAIMANFLRVLSLTVIIYQYGISTERAAHDIAQILELLFALSALLVIKAIVTRLYPSKNG